MAKKLVDSEIVAILNSQIDNAQGSDLSSVETQQANALDYYYGDKSIISTEDGESSFISREVLETVERELGRQLKVFCSGDNTVKFDATGKEDIEQAQQETDFINYVFNKENKGFKIMHDWIKSALLEKNSYVKVWIDEEEEFETETYSNLNDAELEYVMSQEGAEAIEHDEQQILDEVSQQPITLHDIKIRTKSTKKQVKVIVVPNEEIGVARGHYELDLKDCPFVYHKPTSLTVSDLIEAGFNKDLVTMLPSRTDNENTLTNARASDADNDRDFNEEADDSMREVEVYECYIRMDYDGDGVAELRKITISGNEVLENEECDFIPIAVISPIPMAHKHIGLSYADLVMPLQDVKTVLMQQMLTNLYMTNSPEREIVEGQVNIDDLLTSKSGSLKRVKQPNMIRDLAVPFTAGASLPMLDVIDGMIEGRVGRTQPLDPNVLAQSTAGAFAMGVEQDNQLSEKVARTFAETGVKDMFGMIHELVIKHYDTQQTIELRGEYVEINPTEWKKRYNMSIVVGLGTGNKDKEMGQLMQVITDQKEHLLAGSPLVTMQNSFNAYSDLIDISGLKGDYYTDPSSPEAQQAAQAAAQQPPQPDPNMIMIEANKAIEDQKAQLVQQKQAAEAEFKKAEHAIKLRELEIKESEAQAKAATDAANIEVKRYEADLRSETQLAIEQMKSGATIQDAINEVLSPMQQQNDETLSHMINSILGEIQTSATANVEQMQGYNDNMAQQIQTMASQMNRPKRVIYAEDGETPIGVETVME